MTKELEIIKNPDSETPLSIYGISPAGHVLNVEWYNANEGISGDYDPDDKDDINLLRFDVSTKEADDENIIWQAVDDASYCTNMPADTDETILEKALKVIFNEYMNVIDNYWNGSSVKKLGEQLSWISPDDFKETNDEH